MRFQRATLGLLLVLPMAGALAREQDPCAGKSATEIGKALGQAHLRWIKGLADAGIWETPECLGITDVKVDYKEICDAEKQEANLVIGVEEAIHAGCIDLQAEFSRTPDAQMFSALEDNLSSESALQRWHTFLRIYSLCAHPELAITPNGQQNCPDIVEGSSLTILANDHDPFNRHLALEVLTRGYATARSRPILEKIVAAAQDKGRTCPKLFTDGNSDGKPEPALAAMARDYRERRYSCERALALEALSRPIAPSDHP